jgi:hypothetical protein
MALGRMEQIDDVRESRWEFCQLFLDGRWEHKLQWYYDLRIVYISDGTVIEEELASTDPRTSRAFAENPWNLAMGKLGAFGWDLVAVQHSDRASRSTAAQEFGISGSWAIAYFKRRIRTGRAVNEPRLSLER